MKVIAEVGINHNNSLELALELIRQCAAAACSVVKFQYYRAAHLYPRNAGMVRWGDDNGAYSYDIYEACQANELPDAWIDTLMAECAAHKVEFGCSVFDPQGLEFLVSKGLRSIKIASSHVTNVPLLECAAATGLPVYLSTGGAKLSEVDRALEVLGQGRGNVCLMHCNLAYPAALTDVNMGVLRTFALAFPQVELGFSDHTREVLEAPLQAVYLGATVIEKHVTLDKAASGPDHFFAVTPDELARLVAAVHAAASGARGTIRQDIFGQTAKCVHPEEEATRAFAFCTLYAARAIAQGERVTPRDVVPLRPGKAAPGLGAEYVDLLRCHRVTAKKGLEAGAPLTFEDIL